jgi:hypothetical protein
MVIGAGETEPRRIDRMNHKQSLSKLLLGVAGVGLLVTNCTIKSSMDAGSSGNTFSGDCSPAGKMFNGCVCPGSVQSYQVCQADGTYSPCVCPDTTGGGGASSAGATSSAGTGGALSYAGASAGGASPGEAGAAGAEAISTDCLTCLTQLCGPEWDACNLNDENNPDPDGNYCISSNLDGSGQIEAIIVDCITTERAKGLVKRDAVRACGSSIGKSADPSFFKWAPVGMTPETEALMNCMADAPDETTPGAWATNSSNFPASGARPWDDGTCAKIACTSGQ